MGGFRDWASDPVKWNSFYIERETELQQTRSCSLAKRITMRAGDIVAVVAWDEPEYDWSMAVLEVAEDAAAYRDAGYTNEQWKRDRMPLFLPTSPFAKNGDVQSQEKTKRLTPIDKARAASRGYDHADRSRLLYEWIDSGEPWDLDRAHAVLQIKDTTILKDLRDLLPA